MDARVPVGELVSQHAEQLDTQEKVAQQLGRAIHRAMNSSRMQGNRFKVHVEADMACAWYTIRIVDQGPWGGGSQTYVVTDETLANNTSSVGTFHSWIQAVSARLMTMFVHEPMAPSLDDPNRFLEAAKGRAQHRLLLHGAQEELVSLGFTRHVDDECDVEAAIASIRKALNDG